MLGHRQGDTQWTQTQAKGTSTPPPADHHPGGTAEGGGQDLDVAAMRARRVVAWHVQARGGAWKGAPGREGGT